MGDKRGSCGGFSATFEGTSSGILVENFRAARDPAYERESVTVTQKQRTEIRNDRCIEHLRSFVNLFRATDAIPEAQLEGTAISSNVGNVKYLPSSRAI